MNLGHVHQVLEETKVLHCDGKTKLFFVQRIIAGCTGAQLAKLLPHNARHPDLFPTSDAVCANSTRSLSDCMGFLWVLRFPPKVQVCSLTGLCEIAPGA